ncbi:MAG: 1,2-phenylacetyl-CoA epoxidase subunit PaaC [Actinomycetota bacterium]|nr:phenylacetate-CoA oxygenase subunit PaaC [Actinomycetota bacterium]
MSTDPCLSLLLAIADDEFVLGHRLGEWTGWVPYVEEDLALSSIAQDEIGHARALYEIASAIDGRSADELALGRAPDEYRNCHLVEHPNRDFAYTIARQWLYDSADAVRLRALSSSSLKELRDLVAVLQLEERYHLEHASEWFKRLARGPVEARHKLTEALELTIGEAFWIFEPLEGEDELVSSAVLPEPMSALQERWIADVRAQLLDASLDHVLSPHEAAVGDLIPTSAGSIIDDAPTGGGTTGAGGRRGVHSDDFMPMWEEMTALYRAHPGARW